ncbi:MAG: hypothetical protein A2Y41_11590 [Spirochaetes bacterium GWB1_36_13]|nr:MAG: hypothetical protein A2Y41_11590 [Spirochaetes bacterium GWB1_36_13]
MSEKVIKARQIKESVRPIIIEPPKIESFSEHTDEEGEEISKQPTGPSPEEIQKILDDKRKEAEDKYNEIIFKSKEEAQKIKKEAEVWAFNQVKKINEDYDTRLKEADLRGNQLIQEAELKARNILMEAEKQAEKLKKEASVEGFTIGKEDGYNRGDEEVRRIISVLHKISGEFIKKRETIVHETEKALIDLVLLIAGKVVKTISETSKRVIYDNILAALGKLKGRAEVTIRVNPDDIYTVTRYKKEFIETVEGIENIRILEDPNVDRGGCIVTSEFGAVDARISTQLSEIEDQIKKLSPIKNEEME